MIPEISLDGQPSISCTSKSAVGHYHGVVTVIKTGSGVCFLNSFVTDSVGIVFTLDSVFLTVFVSYYINTLIADALRDRYLVKATVSQKLRTSVFKLKSVHWLTPFYKNEHIFA